MYRILKIGMDVHTTNFTLYALESKFGEEDQILANITAGPDHKNVLDFIRRIKEKMDPKGQDALGPLAAMSELPENTLPSDQSAGEAEEQTAKMSNAANTIVNIFNNFAYFFIQSTPILS